MTLVEAFFWKYIYLNRYTFKRLFPRSAWHNMLIQIWDILTLTSFLLITLPNYTTLHSSITKLFQAVHWPKLWAYTSFHEGLHLCWGFLTLVINAPYSLTIPTLHHQPRVLYFPQSHHFFSTVAEAIIPWQDFIPFLFNKHMNSTKQNNGNIGVSFLRISLSILRHFLLFWLLYTLKMSKQHDLQRIFS